MSHKERFVRRTAAPLLVLLLCAASLLCGCASKGNPEKDGLVNISNKKTVKLDDLSPYSEYTGEYYPLRDETGTSIARITLYKGYSSYMPMSDYDEHGNNTGWTDPGAVTLVPEWSDNAPSLPFFSFKLFRENYYTSSSDLSYLNDPVELLRQNYDRMKTFYGYDDPNAPELAGLTWHEFQEGERSYYFFSNIQVTEAGQPAEGSDSADRAVIEYQGKTSWSKEYYGVIISSGHSVLVEARAFKDDEQNPKDANDLTEEQFVDIMKQSIHFVK